MSGSDGRERTLGDTDLKRLHRTWRRRTDARLDLLLDAVGNPFNVGSMLRTAAAERVEHLWLCGQVPAPGDVKVAKTALGTHRYLSWSHAELADALSQISALAMTLVGVELSDRAVPIFDADLSGNVCLALGHEDRGLSEACLRACDQTVYIPQAGKVGSLNVAQAGAIAMYEVRRQQWATSDDGSSG